MAKSLLRSIFDILGLQQRSIRQAQGQLKREELDTDKLKQKRKTRRNQQRKARKRNRT